MAAIDGHIELERTVSSIQIGARHRHDLGDLDTLAASIQRYGLLQPITITPDGVLVCGARRLAAIRQLGWGTVRVWVRSGISDPLDLLKSEQERIRTTHDAIEHRLENLATSYEDAREGLDQLADILTDLGDVYARCEPAERRILNRALFDKIILDDEEAIRHQPDGAVRAALDCVAPGHTRIVSVEASAPEDTSNPAHWSAGQGSKMSLLVELTGFEPVTFCMPCRRATNCAIAPKFFGRRRSDSSNITRSLGGSEIRWEVQ